MNEILIFILTLLVIWLIFKYKYFEKCFLNEMLYHHHYKTETNLRFLLNDYIIGVVSEKQVKEIIEGVKKTEILSKNNNVSKLIELIELTINCKEDVNGNK